MNTRGLRVLITGGARRLGAATARDLAAAEARVAVHYHRSREAAEELADSLPGAVVLQADLTGGAGACERLVQSAAGALGGLDVLINNAAVFRRTPLETAREEAWDEHLDLNLKAPFFCSQAAVPFLRESAPGPGLILNLTEALARRSRPGYGPYIASKAALEALTRTLALELAPGIRVAAVAPGPMLPAAGVSEARLEAIREATPLGRLGGAEAVVSAVRFLILNDFVTGEVLVVDGGRSLA